MKGLVISILVFGLSARAQETAHGVVLQWQDGGRLRGAIAASPVQGVDEVRFVAPQFAGELVLARGALAGIQFEGAAAAGDHAGGAFRVVTTTGDVWTADVVGSDASSLTFRSERLGDVRVPRSAIRTIERTDDPAVLLDASRFAGEIEDLSGPIEDLRFAVYDDLSEIMRRTSTALGIPRNAPGRERVFARITDNELDDIRLDFDGSTQRFDGSRSRGFLDLGLHPSGEFEHMVMVFEGRFGTEADGPHRFEVRATHGARLFVDGALVVEGKTTAGFDGGPALREGTVELTSGAHDLRVVYFNYVKTEHLSVTVTGPGGEERFLTGKNAERSWDRGPGGHARTDAKDTRLWCPVELPAQFEVALELASSASPRFIVSIEGDGDVPALALETWDDLLVVSQGEVFEPMGTLVADRGTVDFVLSFDGEHGQLEVHTGAGRSLGVASGVRPPTGAVGISLRNRGADLVARRLVVRGGHRTAAPQEIDPSRARVQLRDGRVRYGQLELGASGAFVRAENGERENVELTDVDRVLNPTATPRSSAGLATLTWASGAIFHGKVGALRPDRVELVPAFAEEGIACLTAGISSLTFPTPTAAELEPGRFDELVTGAGVVRGTSSFGGDAGTIAFRPRGAADAVQLEVSAEAHIRRSAHDIETGPSFDVGRFPHVLHSRAGGRIPCEFVSWSDGKLTIRHPFGDGLCKVDAGQIKALDLVGKTLSVETYRTTKAFGQLLDRALMIPRFRRKNPDDFLVVARSNDLMRGELVSILGGVLRIESKLKEQDVPLEHLKLVVNIEARTPDETTGARLTLEGGTVLVLAPDAVVDGVLRGRSAACGEVAVSTDRITSVHLGPAVSAAGEGTFSAWVARPAPEPSWDR